MSILYASVLLIILIVPVEYFFSNLCRISLIMIGLTSVSIINSWRFKNRPAIKSAASTFSSEFFSLSSNSFSISEAVE